MKVKTTVDIDAEIEAVDYGRSLANSNSTDQAEFLKGFAEAVYRWRADDPERVPTDIALERQSYFMQEEIEDPILRFKIVNCLIKMAEAFSGTIFTPKSLAWYRDPSVSEDDVKTEQSQ